MVEKLPKGCLFGLNFFIATYLYLVALKKLASSLVCVLLYKQLLLGSYSNFDKLFNATFTNTNAEAK